MHSPRVWKLANLSRLAALLVIVALLGSTTNEGAAAIGWSSFWSPLSNGFKNLFARPAASDAATHPGFLTASPYYLNKAFQRNIRASRKAWNAVIRDRNNPARYETYIAARRAATESYVHALQNAVVLQRQIQWLERESVQPADREHYARMLNAARNNLEQQKHFFTDKYQQAIFWAQMDDHLHLHFGGGERAVLGRYYEIGQLQGELMGVRVVDPHRSNPWPLPGMESPGPVHPAPVHNGPGRVAAPVDEDSEYLAENPGGTVSYAKPVPFGSRPA